MKAMKKYTKRTGELIRHMQHCDVTLMRRMELTGLTRTTATAASFAYCGGHPVSEQAWNAIMKTRGDLIKLVSGSNGIMGSSSYALTERGKTVMIDKNGQEQPKDWTPKPRVVKWPGCRCYLLPTSENIVMVIEAEEDDKLFRDVVGMKNPDPWLQIPSPNPVDHPTVSSYYNAKSAEYRADPKKGRVMTFAEAVNHFKWDVLMTREIEGFISEDTGFGSLIGFIKSRFGWHEFEPSGKEIVTGVENLILDRAIGRLDSLDYGPANDKRHAQILNGGLSMARRLANKPRSSDQTIWYFKVKVELDAREEAVNIFWYTEFEGDAILRPDPIHWKPVV